MPFFSIIIPAHNEEGYIRETLHSINSSTYQNFEVLVVANGCTDKTEEIVRKRADERVKLFSLAEANVSKARNFGADLAQGEILLFLDADTKLHAHSLQRIATDFKNGFSYGTTRTVPDREGLKYSVMLGLKNFYLRTGVYKGCSGAFICKKNDFVDVKGYNPDMQIREHHELIKRLGDKGKYAFIDTPVTTSMRRYAEWGMPKWAWFWVKSWALNRKKEYEKIR